MCTDALASGLSVGTVCGCLLLADECKLEPLKVRFLLEIDDGWSRSGAWTSCVLARRD
jgi:hypothetical protein